MKDPELISTPNDKRVGGLPRHRAARASGRGPLRPALWDAVETMHAPEPCFGAYPNGFLEWAVRMLRAPAHEVLHVCSGMLSADDAGGAPRIDVRIGAKPTVVADGRRLPFSDGTIRAALIDPPYSVEYAEELYGIEYPRPSHLLVEAARVVAPCGRIGILHYLVPSPPARCKIVAIRGVTQGVGYRIRALTVYAKEQRSLW